MDEYGYNPSIMQKDLTRCYLCGRSDQKLDRHEIFHADFGGRLREKSKQMGLWVMLCHHSCHLHGAHADKRICELLKQEGQRRCMDYYGFTTDDFTEIFGRNYL